MKKSLVVLGFAAILGACGMEAQSDKVIELDHFSIKVSADRSVTSLKDMTGSGYQYCFKTKTIPEVCNNMYPSNPIRTDKYGFNDEITFWEKPLVK